MFIRTERESTVPITESVLRSRSFINAGVEVYSVAVLLICVATTIIRNYPNTAIFEYTLQHISSYLFPFRNKNLFFFYLVTVYSA